MPMLDAYILEGALPPEAADKLLARLTGLLLQHEGVDPATRPLLEPRHALTRLGPGRRN